MSDLANKHIPYCDKQGIQRICASGRPDHGVFGFLITCGGTGTDAVDFSDLGFTDMADAEYAVMVGSEAGTVVIDESTKTTTGFNLITGAAAEVANIIVAGKFASMVK